MPDLSLDEYRAQLEKKYGDRRAAEFTTEWPTIEVFFGKLLQTLAANYSIESVLAVGGTGVVHKGFHKRFNQPVVIKFNRPLQTTQPSMVANEATVLPTLSHPNVIWALDLGDMPTTPTCTYIVEPFISGSCPLFTHDQQRLGDTWLVRRLEAAKSHVGSSLPGLEDETGTAVGELNAILGDLAALFGQWVAALEHLHKPTKAAPSGYVYLDVKPENVLVDLHRHLTLIDYGSVERVDHEDHTSLEIFVTKQYRHPELAKYEKQKPSSNRVVGGVKRSVLRPAFDYFALGSSMLEVLNEVAQIRPHLVPQLPLYRSLHFLATRLLDGENSTRSTDNIYRHAPQVFPGLEEGDYKSLSYRTLSDTYRDLQKERGRWDLARAVPELASFSKDIVRIVPGFHTVLTARLRGVIEHPLVARLKYVTQLGLVSLLYPTADHARYDHGLGSYTYTTYYIRSLFNDLGSPIFRSLVTADDLNAVLLAALLHDLGQYPLAHDLEEVHERIFKHASIGADLMKDGTRDKHGRTLRDIIEKPEHGWGVPLEVINRIFGAKAREIVAASRGDDAGRDGSAGSLKEPPPKDSPSFRNEVLAAIIDGPVDADKADYIIRDSARCELPYGDQLDIERLLRVLTVALIPAQQGSRRKVTLGVYDKGIASAHAFGQARHQLLSTVYWHHTSRVAKAMLQYATAGGLPADVFAPPSPGRDNQETQVREELLEFIKSLVPPFPRSISEDTNIVNAEPAADLVAEPADVALETLQADVISASDTSGWYPGIAWTDWLMLRWLAQLPNASIRSRALLAGIRTRRLYKRVETLQRGGPNDDLIRKLDGLSWPDKLELCDEVSTVVAQKIRREWTNIDTVAAVSKSQFDQLCESNHLVLLDVPNPAAKVGYDRDHPLGVVPELKEKSYRKDSGVAFEDTSWRTLMEQMIRDIAPVRILCHPAARNLVSAAYAGPDADLASVVKDSLAGK